MALVDADYKFIWADLGSTGSVSAALIYNNSEIKELAEDETIRFPAPYPLPNDYQDVPYFSIGDGAFALRETMINPWGYFLVKGYWGCAAGWGLIFTTGLTIMELHF